MSPSSIFEKKIIKHRANKLKTIRRSIRNNEYGIEIDIHLTADNHLILIHDPNIGKFKTYQMTLAEIRKVKKVITLKEVFELQGIEQIQLMIHVHNWFSSVEGYNSRLIEALVTLTHDKIDNIHSFISFDIAQLSMIRERLDVPIAYCVDNNDGLYAVDMQQYLTINDVLKRLKDNNINTLVVNDSPLDLCRKLYQNTIKLITSSFAVEAECYVFEEEIQYSI